MERVVIDTDGLRDLVRRLQGALHELADVKLDVTRASGLVGGDATVSTSFQQLLAGLDAFGSALTDDRDRLVSEVVTLEQLDGQPPATTTAFETGDEAPVERRRPMLTMPRSVHAVYVAMESTADAPEPWDRPWVRPDGSVVDGQDTTVASWSEDWGATWEDRAHHDTDLVQTRGSTGASYWIYGEGSVKQDDGNVTVEGATGVGVETHVSVHGETDVGPVHLEGEVAGSAVAKGEAHASGSVGEDGISWNVGASTEVGVRGEVTGTFDDGTIDGSVTGYHETKVAGSAHHSGQIGPDGMSSSTGMDAMAGSSQGVEVGAGGPGGTDGSAGANVKEGAGVEVSGSGEISPDKVGASVKLGGALGVGVGVELEASFSPKELLGDVTGALTNPLEPLKEIGSKIEDVGELWRDASGELTDFVNDSAHDPSEVAHERVPDQDPTVGGDAETHEWPSPEPEERHEWPSSEPSPGDRIEDGRANDFLRRS